MDKQEKKDIRRPDQVKQALESLMHWVQQNFAVLGLVFVGFVILGAGWSVWDYFQSEKEESLQGQVALIEKDYFEQKEKFQTAEREAAMKQAAPPKKDKKEELPPVTVAATGDVQKDYGPILQRFSEVADKNPKSRAAKMSALYSAEIYTLYKQPDPALQTLEKVSPQNNAKDMLSGLVLNMKAGLMAEKGQCEPAVQIWKKVTEQKKLFYLHDDAKLRMALCYEKMNDVAKAEQLYSEISQPSADKQERVLSEDAKKYLRLLKMKGQSGT